MPLSVCVEPGCPGFAAARGRCEQHASQRAAEAKARTKGVKYYNTKRWKSLRRFVLRRDRYTCQECRRFGNEVDHIVPIVQGGEIWSEDNLQVLCKSCHSRKTAKEVWT